MTMSDPLNIISAKDAKATIEKELKERKLPYIKLIGTYTLEETSL
jgi:hypothetical protein